MPEYTVATLAATVTVVAMELGWARTGIFRSLQYWLAMSILFGFQALVDGRLTRLPDPIVAYAPGQASGLRFPFDIPVEDFGFGFALMTATIIGWILAGRSRPSGDSV
ncbi:MAG: lycopene cyclase domain-containing protein [Candidatus Nanopelagicales bacterium]